MSNIKEPWFVEERSEALAGLLLTSRNDVRVQTEAKLGDGVDFLVGINSGEELSTRLFVVQVKGTTESNPNDWMQNVKQLFKSNGRIYLPVCVFVVNVRDNRSQYAWVAEPVVEANGARLVLHEDGQFQTLDASTVTDIVEREKTWYDAFPKHFVPPNEQYFG